MRPVPQLKVEFENAIITRPSVLDVMQRTATGTIAHVQPNFCPAKF